MPVAPSATSPSCYLVHVNVGSSPNWVADAVGGGSGSVTVNGVNIALNSSGNVGSLFDTNGNASITTTTTASAVDFLNVTNVATGGTPSLLAAGSDATVGFELGNKGATSTLTFGGSGFGTFNVATAQTMNFEQNGSTIFQIGTNGNFFVSPGSGQNFGVTLAGNGTFSLTGSPTAADVPQTIKYGTASPTADGIQLKNSSSALIDGVIGPSGIIGNVGNQIISGADYTNATTTPSTLWSWTLPPTVSAKTYSYACTGFWQGSSTSTTLALGVNISAAPTQTTANAIIVTAVAGTFTTGYISNTTTGAQNVLTSAVAGASTTNYPFRFFGTIEGAATAGSTFTITGAAGVASTTVTVKRGASCRLEAIQ